MDLEKRWYVVRTYSGHEAKVKIYLESEVARLNLQERIGSVLIPSEKVIEVKDGKKKAKVKNFFPGYILVEAVIDKETTHLISEAPSVLGFGPDKNNPVPLQPDEVRRLIGKMEEREDVVLVEVPFRVGDAVKVVEGPFNNFNGFVQEVHPEKLKVKVMVSIFGRKTPVELDFGQVEAEK
ncbi:MAG: transcription termination/antitermination factor NusG [Ignavibacteriales bacterium]|nr:transcription termination/antitermination factor NusG [Ignavibacteriales bacterium]